MLQKAKMVFMVSAITISSVSADTSADTKSALNQALQALEMRSDVPDWAKRTSINIQVEEEFKPLVELETVQPVYQFNENDMWFWQFNFSNRNSLNTVNFGTGYRNIITPELMLGINTFYDYQQDNKHRRWGVGFEAIGKKYEARVNRYLGLSSKKEVEAGVFEEVVDGWDAEIGGKVIPNSDLKLFAQYSVWEGIQKDDYKQRSVRATYPLNDSMSFELKYTDDDKKQGNLDDSRFSAQLSIALGKKSSKSQNLDRSENLKDKLLIPVQRNNEIMVERTVGARVTIGRGT